MALWESLNHSFYAYLICLKKLGYQPYRDVKQLIFNLLAPSWNGVMYPKHRSGPIRDFGFKETYSIEIPPNSLKCILIYPQPRIKRNRAKCYSNRSIYLILNPNVTKRIREFEKSFIRRGYQITSCVTVRFSKFLDCYVDILALGWNSRFLEAELSSLKIHDYFVSTPSRIRNPLEKYAVTIGDVIPTRTVLDFSTVISEETTFYWCYRRDRQKECLLEFQKLGIPTHFWTLNGEVSIKESS